MKKYDFLIVGCGLYGATFAEQALKHGKKVLIIDKRNHIGGNIYTKEIEGIHVHVYGAHIFHTSNERVWGYINQFAVFNNFVNTVLANYKGEIYHLPFNMNTFHELWGVDTKEEAVGIINKQINEANINKVTNLEEQAISLVGVDVYEKLIKGYTEKQWGRSCKELPPFIIKRIPMRFTYDNNYFDDVYQGIPIGGYTKMIEKMISGADVILSTDYQSFMKSNNYVIDKIIYTGPIDEYYSYCLGRLEYRTVSFENSLIDIKTYQNNAVVNYTDRETPYTRIIEHKYFDFHNQSKTFISKEYPAEYKDGMEPYYPINNDKNTSLFNKYLEMASKEKNIYFKGRLGEYKYYDMDDVILSALSFADDILK